MSSRRNSPDEQRVPWLLVLLSLALCVLAYKRCTEPPPHEVLRDRMSETYSPWVDGAPRPPYNRE